MQREGVREFSPGGAGASLRGCAAQGGVGVKGFKRMAQGVCKSGGEQLRVNSTWLKGCAWGCGIEGAWAHGSERMQLRGGAGFQLQGSGMWLRGVCAAQGDAEAKGRGRMAQSTKGFAAHGGCGSSAPGMRAHGSKGVQLRG